MNADYNANMENISNESLYPHGSNDNTNNTNGDNGINNRNNDLNKEAVCTMYLF